MTYGIRGELGKAGLVLGCCSGERTTRALSQDRVIWPVLCAHGYFYLSGVER